MRAILAGGGLIAIVAAFVIVAGGKSQRGKASSGAAPGAHPTPTNAAESSEARLAPFAGVWRVNSGSATRKCSGQEDRTVNPAGHEVTFVPGSNGRLQVTSGKCTTNYTVTGTTATAIPGQKCATLSNENEALTEVVSAGFSVQGKSAKGESHSKTTITLKGGQRIECSLNGHSELSRVR